MITKVDNIQSVGIGFKYPTEFFGLSTDTKPTDTANGSLFTEIDSGKKYMFDFAGSQWCEIPAAESGGGSSGGVLVVHVDWDTADGTLDKTWQEIADADYAVLKVAMEGGNAYASIFICQHSVSYGVGFISYDMADNAVVTMLFAAASADDYPVFVEQ